MDPTGTIPTATMPTATPAEGAPSSTTRMCFVGVALLALAFVGLQARALTGTLPYPQHYDERYLMEAGQRVLSTGDLNPKLYSYPSLPAYMTTAALAYGLIATNKQGPEHVGIGDIGRLTPPYYSQPDVAAAPRKAWVGMSALTLLLIAILAFRLSGPVCMLIATALLALCPRLFGSGWIYINVDLPAACLIAAVLAYITSAHDDASFRSRVLIPGLLCGAATACKYTAALSIVPCLAAIWIFETHARLRFSIALGGVVAAAFIALCPFFILDLPGFVDAVAFEQYHYAVRGHARFDVDPGLPQLVAYFGDAVGEYGWLTMGLCLLGIGRFSWQRPRFAVVLLSLPILWLVFLMGYKVHFGRNALPVFVLIPVFAAIGMTWLHSRLRAWLAAVSAWPQLARGYRADVAAGVLVAGTLVASLPHAAIASAHWHLPDSRNVLGAWAREALPANTQLLVPGALAVSCSRRSISRMTAM
jgi:hypothetical protein